MKTIFEFGEWRIEQWNTRSKNYKIFRRGHKRVWDSASSFDGAIWLIAVRICHSFGYPF